jgi:hypothetical protein
MRRVAMETVREGGVLRLWRGSLPAVAMQVLRA